MEKTGNSTVLMLGVAGMGLSLAMFIDAMKMKSNETPEKHTEDITEDITEDNIQTTLGQLYNIKEEAEVLSVPSSNASSEASSEASSKVSSEASSEASSEEPTEELVEDIVEEPTEENDPLQNAPGSQPPPDEATSGGGALDHNLSNWYEPESKNAGECMSSSVSEPPPVKKRTKRRKKARDLTPGPEMTTQERIDYKKFYKNKKREILEEYINKQPDNSYKGDGSPWSKRMYFIKEAYRRSREKTPIMYTKP